MTIPVEAQIVAGVVVIALAIVMLAFRGQAAAVRKNVPMVKGERVRPLGMEFTEPLLEVAVIALLLWSDLSGGWDHWLVGALGIIPGYFIGRYRARIMYVRAVKEYKSVVMRRSQAEYIAVAVVVAIKMLGENLPVNNPATSLIISFALITVVSESIFRVLKVASLYKEGVDNTHLKPGKLA